MSSNIQLSQTSELTQAYRLVETLVLRTNQGRVFSIEVGETLLEGSGSAFGGKVTLQATPPVHIGFPQGASPQEVIQAAEALIANTPIETDSSAAIPKPHIKSGSRVNA